MEQFGAAKQPARNVSLASASKRSDAGGEKKQEPIVNKDKVGRNDPCPCGSGKKYKKCHGK